MRLLNVVVVSLVLFFNFASFGLASTPCSGENLKRNEQWCAELEASYSRRAAERLAEQQPEGKRAVFRTLYVELVRLPVDDLYLLKADDPCGYPDILQCRGVEGAQLKPFVETALDLQKETIARRESEISRYISIGGFGISLCSLMISLASGRRKKDDAGPIVISRHS